MNIFKRNPWLRSLANAGKSPWVRWGSRATIVGGFVTGAGLYISDGDDGATAVIKSGVETGFSAVGGLGGTAAGLACGEAAVVCSPVAAVGGAVAGGWFGGEVNEGLESGFFWGLKPYEATDRWFDWD
jgi:hypothetical protein